MSTAPAKSSTESNLAKSANPPPELEALPENGSFPPTCGGGGTGGPVLPPDPGGGGLLGGGGRLGGAALFLGGSAGVGLSDCPCKLESGRGTNGGFSSVKSLFEFSCKKYLSNIKSNQYLACIADDGK